MLGSLLRDPELARLYWAFSKIDPQTGEWLRTTIGIKSLVPHAATLDFYGGYLNVRASRVTVPGGPAADAAWDNLVGASPKSASDFVRKLLSRDGGWMAAYFDVLSRAGTSHQAYFTQEHRLRSFYNALRASSSSTNATNGSFRPAPGLLLFVTRLQWDANGKPLVPGGLPLGATSFGKKASHAW